jgi:hypothetical protein
MASRQAKCGLKPFYVIWLIIDYLSNCLTKVHSIDGMHPAARIALLPICGGGSIGPTFFAYNKGFRQLCALQAHTIC